MKHSTATLIITLVILGINSYCASGVRTYPKFSHVFNDPRAHDQLIGTTLLKHIGGFNETLRFTRILRLTSVVLPSQGYRGSEGEYDEDISVQLFQTKLCYNHAEDKTTLVAVGRFQGKARYGQELHVPLHVVNGEEAPVMAVYEHAEWGSQYLLSLSFGKEGMYPYYNERKFSISGSMHDSCEVAGFMIGLSYTLAMPSI